MAAGFYCRACEIYGDRLEPVRFVVNHYNYDVRRDRPITNLVHQTLLEHLPSTKESDEMLGDILLMERRLFGTKRLQPITGDQWLCLGCPLKDLKEEKELVRIMNLPTVKEFGNLEVSWLDKEGRWKEATLRCLPEPEGTPAPLSLEVDVAPITASGLAWSTAKPVATIPDWRLRALKPAPPLTWREYTRERLLQLWVYFFSFWAIFFMVDEEVITLIGLIWGKYHHSKIMAAEAERLGTRPYSTYYRWY